eukprot:s2206_g9.t1
MRTAFRDGDKKEPCSVPVLCIVQRHVQVFHLQTVSAVGAVALYLRHVLQEIISPRDAKSVMQPGHKPQLPVDLKRPGSATALQAAYTASRPGPLSSKGLCASQSASRPISAPKLQTTSSAPSLHTRQGSCYGMGVAWAQITSDTIRHGNEGEQKTRCHEESFHEEGQVQGCHDTRRHEFTVCTPPRVTFVRFRGIKCTRSKTPAPAGLGNFKIRIGIIHGKVFDPIKVGTHDRNYPEHLKIKNNTGPNADGWGGQFMADVSTGLKIVRLHPDIFHVDFMTMEQVTEKRLSRNHLTFNFWGDMSIALMNEKPKLAKRLQKIQMNPNFRHHPVWDYYEWILHKSRYMKACERAGIPMIDTIHLEKGFNARDVLKKIVAKGWDKFFVKPAYMRKTQDFIDNIEPLLQYEAENKHQKEFLVQPYMLKPNGEVFDEIRNFFCDGEWAYSVYTDGVDYEGFWEQPKGKLKEACKKLAIQTMEEVKKVHKWEGKRINSLLNRIDIGIIPDKSRKLGYRIFVNEIEPQMTTWLGRYCPFVIQDRMAEVCVKQAHEMLKRSLAAKRKMPSPQKVRQLLDVLDAWMFLATAALEFTRLFASLGLRRRCRDSKTASGAFRWQPRLLEAGYPIYLRMGKLVHGLASSTASINKKAERLEVLEDTDLLPPPMSPELKKTFRTDDVGEERADDSEEKRAEERRKREQEAKKAREKAQNTKDPRRRVAVMLEQGREWGQARPDQARDRKVNVPMQQHLALHSGGAERIEMVHVCALQGRCKGLSSGSCNYKEVRNLVEEEERQAKWLQSTAPAEPKDFIKDNKEQNCYSTGEYSQDAAEALEAKLALAKKRKARAHEAKLQKKLEMLIKRRSPSVMTGSIRRASGQKAPPTGESAREPLKRMQPCRYIYDMPA